MNEPTPQELKEAFINKLVADIESDFADGKTLSTRKSTCDHRNWSQPEHLYMPIVADRLRAKGYGVTSLCRHGVMDYTIVL